MLHTIEIPKRDLTNVDESHHEISSYCRECLKEFKGGNIVVKEDIDEQGLTFKVVDVDDVIEHEGPPGIRKTSLGFAHWDKEVESLDDDNNDGCSDEAMCFGMSNRLRWKDVELVQGQYYSLYRAPNIDRLKDALSHVYICAWCILDI